ncbi:MAG: tetratricopeptide repeat protein [Myxococcota bacterium]|nr:tetratricopeptide repeat protein [Myxococcota bacterium]
MLTRAVTGLVAIGLFVGGAKEAGADGGELKQLRADLTAVSDQIQALDKLYLAGAIREQGNRFAARMNDGQLFFVSKAYDRAAMVFLDLVEDQSNRSKAGYRDAVFFLAESLYQVRNWSGSIRYFESLATLGSSTQKQHAVARLLELSGLANDGNLGRKYVAVATQSLQSQASPLLQYALGKYQYRQNRLSESRTLFSQVSAGTDVYVKAQYFLGVVFIRLKNLDSAEAAFRAAFAASENAQDGTENKLIRDEALLALARIAYEKSQFDIAVDLYNRVPRQSPKFDEAMYELVWIAIKARDYERALRKLDLLLISQPEVLDSSDARLLKGKLKLMLKDYLAAEQSFLAVSDAFGLIKTEMEDVEKKHRDLARHFDKIIGDRIADFDLRSVLPKKATKVAGDDLARGRDVRLVADVAAQRRDMEQAKRNVKLLEAALASDARAKIFPKVNIGLLRAVELKTRLALIRARLNDVSGRQPVGRQSDYNVLRTERQSWQSRLENVPRSVARIQERNDKVEGKMAQLDQAAHRLRVDLRGVEAQLVAIDKYLKDSDDTTGGGAANRSLQREKNEAKKVKAEIEELVSRIDKERLNVGLNDAASRNDEKIFLRFNDALKRESEWLIGRNALLERPLYEQTLALDGQVDRFSQAAQKLIGTRIAEFKSILRAERSRMTTYNGELSRQEASTRALGGAIAARTFRRVLKKITGIVIEADVGLVDVSWKRKDDKSKDIGRVFERQRAEYLRLQTLFEEVTGE